jgi:hypothetical protein
MASGGFGVGDVWPSDTSRDRSRPTSLNNEYHNRPEIEMLREIVPGLDKAVLLQILKGNNFDLAASIDAALALTVSLDAEEGKANFENQLNGRSVSNSGEFQSRGYVSSVTPHNGSLSARTSPKPTDRRPHTAAGSSNSGSISHLPPSNSTTPTSTRRDILNARAAEIAELIGPNGKLNPSQGVVTSVTGGDGKGKIAYVDRNYMRERSTINRRNKRGADVILPPSFLAPPQYRVTVDKATESSVYYSVLYRRRNRARLGITIQDINGDILIQHLYRSDESEQSEPLLALESGVHVGDVLIGINDEYFSPGPEIQDIVDILHLEGDLVTLHFVRYVNVGCRDLFQPHRLASILHEQGVFNGDLMKFVSKAIMYQSRRILAWDTEAISKRIIRWSLETMAYSPAASSAFAATATSLNTYTGLLNIPAVATLAQANSSVMDMLSDDSAAARNTNVVIPAASVRPALSVRIMRAETRRDHVVYVIWVMDVLSGAEWVVHRRFKEFLEFRDVSSAILCFTIVRRFNVLLVP